MAGILGLGAQMAMSFAQTAVATQRGRRRGGGALFGDTPRRRRRTKLTQGQILELTQIKNILGKTAAANALPFYLKAR